MKAAQWAPRCQRAIEDQIAVALKVLGGEPAPSLTLPRSALGSTATTFRLTAFETRTLALLAGIEIDPRVRARLSELGIPNLTLGALLTRSSDGHLNAASLERPLRRWALVRTSDGPILDSAMQIDERVLFFLLGALDGSAYLPDGVEERNPPPPSPRGEAAAEEVERLRRAHPEIVPHLIGESIGELEAVAGSAARLAGRAGLLVVGPSSSAHIRVTVREALLTGRTALVLARETSDGALPSEPALPLIAASARGASWSGAVTATIPVPPPDIAARARAWRRAAPELDARDAVELAAQFKLEAQQIGEVATRTMGGDRAARWRAAKELARPAHVELVRRITSTARFDDLIASPKSTEALHRLIRHVRARATVFETWAFQRWTSRGRGVAALFWGPSGTGKTTAAEVVASALDLDLCVVDTSAVVSKYIGETEENLRKVFSAAERGGAVLLFDEADALFGRRSEVKDAADRHSNNVVSYLLQRIESYDGLAILTTNLRDGLDTAFTRRLHHIVEFPFPSVHERRRLWMSLLGSGELPLHDSIDVDALAAFDLTGASVRDAIVRACVTAAAETRTIRHIDLLTAVREEHERLGVPFEEVSS